MLYISVLVLLTLLFPFMLRKIFIDRQCRVEAELKRLRQEEGNVAKDIESLENENAVLEINAEETIALYQITKEICQSLDEEKVLSVFCERAKRYVEIEECKFIGKNDDVQRFNNHTVLPLDIHKHSAGHLVASPMSEKDKGKFHILMQQLFIGLNRAYLYQRVSELTITDSLTQLFNRRYFMEKLEQEVERSRKFGYKLSLLMIDLDDFKRFNDTYGHLVGDFLLREVSKTIKDNVRQVDFSGRYGGEELCVALTETDSPQADFVAERIRQAIEAKIIPAYDERLRVTVSIGISVFPKSASSVQALIERSDKAMYRAKDLGKNRVEG